MEKALGYILACIISFTAYCAFKTFLQSNSSLHRKEPQTDVAPPIWTQTVISFSLLLPFAVLGFVTVIFMGMILARELAKEGHLQYFATALCLPTVSFLLGYFYFKKVVFK